MAGFTTDVSPVTEVPQLPELTFDLATSSLARADVTLLQLVEVAKRRDGSGSSPQNKAEAWDELASYTQDGRQEVLHSLAVGRRDAWTKVATALATRAAQLDRVRADMERDTEKLKRLLALDNDVLSTQQKRAFEFEFEQTYAPWRRALEEEGAVTRDDDMVAIASGSYTMGAVDGELDERPLHEVQLAAFELDRTEVTVRAYEKCVRAGACSPADTGSLCNAGQERKSSHPINCVDWTQATSYCRWAGKRLPTEEEWEYAARGSDGRHYPWGNQAPDTHVCWEAISGEREGTCEVGTHPRGDSPFGIHDLSGNVWEWTSSGYSPEYGKLRSLESRVARGGGWWFGGASLLRATFRFRNASEYKATFLGFRCAR
jgi:formylglycine-generating enzyme required for sulfatase activity